ncbi:hypothetical protein ACFPXP_07940, partial [Marinicrinis lubricantis]
MEEQISNGFPDFWDGVTTGSISLSLGAYKQLFKLAIKKGLKGKGEVPGMPSIVQSWIEEVLGLLLKFTFFRSHLREFSYSFDIPIGLGGNAVIYPTYEGAPNAQEWIDMFKWGCW